MVAGVRALSAVLAVGLAVGLVGGCGTATLSPAAPGTSSSAFATAHAREIAGVAAAELQKVRSLHLEGTDRYDDSSARMDITADATGSCVGSFVVEHARFQVIHDRERGWYLQGNAGYWTRFAPRKQRMQAVARFADRWLHVDESRLDKELTDTCDLDWIRHQVVPEDRNGCVQATGGPTTDEPTVQVWCGDTHVWVATRSPHRPVRFETRDGREKVEVGGYDEPVDYGLPSDSEVVDLTDSDLA